MVLLFTPHFSELAKEAAPGKETCSKVGHGTDSDRFLTRAKMLKFIRALLASWLLFCLVISESYSGNLKAVLTTPGFTRSAESVGDIVGGGYRWQMVNYFDSFTEAMANSDEPDMKRLWEGMNFQEYAPMPDVRTKHFSCDMCMCISLKMDNSFQLKDVFAGSTVHIDWFLGLETSVKVHYTTPGGKPLVVSYN